jgi:hypothetical protein
MKKNIIINKSALFLSKEIEAFLLFFILLLPIVIIAFKLERNFPNFSYGLLFFTGWLSWTFIEYFNHRFRMHGNGDHSKTIGYERHIFHHHHPTGLKITGLQRLLLLIGNMVLLLLCFLYQNWILLPSGFYTGFVIYTLMHWLLHRKISAQLFPEVHQFHIHHHCKHPDKCFGVTVTWWDHLFDTIPHQQNEITERVKAFYYKT